MQGRICHWWTWMIKLVRILIVMFPNEKMIRLWNKSFIIDYFFSCGIFCLHCTQLWPEYCGATALNSFVHRNLLTASSDVTLLFNSEKNLRLTMHVMVNSDTIASHAVVSSCYFLKLAICSTIISNAIY